jgi:hypothetical protein
MAVTRVGMAELRLLVNQALDAALGAALFLRSEDYTGEPATAAAQACYRLDGISTSPLPRVAGEDGGADCREVVIEIHVWVTPAQADAAGDDAADTAADTALAAVEERVWSAGSLRLETDRAATAELEVQGSRRARGLVLTLTALAVKEP